MMIMPLRLDVFPLAPIVGNQTLNVGVISYAGQLNFTAVADRNGRTDLNLFIQGARSALDELAGKVLMSISGQAPVAVSRQAPQGNQPQEGEL
jgi:hypothetical protein